jgi:hypothetical protein
MRPKRDKLRRDDEEGEPNDRRAAGDALSRCRPGYRRSPETMEVHRSARHDGRDRMLVDHLGDRIAQQDHVLVERLDLALQLDSVDEVDRDGNVFLAQQRSGTGSCSKLPFVAHDIRSVLMFAWTDVTLSQRDCRAVHH